MGYTITKQRTLPAVITALLAVAIAFAIGMTAVDTQTAHAKQLTSKQVAAYMCKAAKSTSGVAKFPKGDTCTESVYYKALFQIYAKDNSDYRYKLREMNSITTDITYEKDGETVSDWAITGVKASGFMGISLSKVKAMEKACLSAASKAISKAKKIKKKSKRAKYLHDWLAKRITYSTKGKSAYGLPGYFIIALPYSGLVKKKGVCDSYSWSYQMLCQKAGLPCKVIFGSDKQGYSHSWNQVKIGSKWYYVDVTWDDQGSTILTKYFKKSKTTFKKDHVFGDQSRFSSSAG